MALGKKIIAIIHPIEGRDPQVEIVDNRFLKIKADDDLIYITEAKSQEYCIDGESDSENLKQ